MVISVAIYCNDSKGLKYLILMQGIYMAEGILKVHVYFLKYPHWLAWYIIFGVYMII